VPKKLSRQKPIAYATIMGIGYFIASVLGFVLLKTLRYIDEPLFFPQAGLACVNGVVWAIASVSVLSSIDRIGLAKSNQWKSLQGPFGSVLMMTFLSEFLTTKVFFIVLAIVFITLAAMMLSVREKNNAPIDKLGVVYALVAAVFYGISTFLSKCLTNEGSLFAQQIYKALFVFLTAAAFVLIKDKSFRLNAPKTKKEFVLPLLGGLLFFGNASFYLLAYFRLEGSIVMMLHQLNAVWLLLLGVFAFKEIDFRKHWLRLMIGLVFSMIGLLMLILAKA
jgi:glucose uptake protein GlcU